MKRPWSWLLRLTRLCQQNAIRLPRRDLTPTDLHPGDRLRIAACWWRILDRREEGASFFFQLESEADGARSRVLRGDHRGDHCFDHGAEGSRWWLIHEGKPLEIDGRTLVHFAVNGTRSGLSERHDTRKIREPSTKVDRC